MFELLFSLMLAMLPANFPTSPVVNSELTANAVVSVHADRSVSMVGVLVTEQLLICSVSLSDGATAPSSANGPPHDPPLGTLTESWKNDTGGTTTVSTPIVSTTPSALDKTIELHRELVRRMKVIYPPVKPPTPTP